MENILNIHQNEKHSSAGDFRLRNTLVSI